MSSKVQRSAANSRRKPPNAGKGRKAGVPNKTTKLLKEAILLAAEKRGADGKGKDGLMGYCLFLARKQPKSFAALLGRVLPMQIAGEGDAPSKVVFQTVYEQRPSD